MIFIFDVYVHAAAAIVVLIVVALYEVVHLKQTDCAITISRRENRQVMVLKNQGHTTVLGYV